MAKESLQKKLGRVRPPRVHITYDVEVGDAIEKRDLPFVVGVLADLSGMPEKPLPVVEANTPDSELNEIKSSVEPLVGVKLPTWFNANVPSSVARPVVTGSS